jgi:hypothetical protein
VRTIRLICTESESGAACNVGGPVVVTYRTFDLPCPPEVAEWLSGRGAYVERFISGVEVVSPPNPPASERAERE